MRVLFVNRDTIVGGGNTYLVHLGRALVEQGAWAGILVSGGGAWLPRFQASFRTTKVIPLYHPIQAPLLALALRRHKIDVVNSHAFTQARIADRACRLARVPHVVTMHGGIGPRRKLQYRPILERAAATIVMNERLALFYGQLGIPADRIVLSRLPLPMPRQARLEPREARRFAYCSRLSGNKAPKCAAWLRGLAEARLAAERITVIGDGDERSKLERLASDLGLDVEWAGAMSDAAERFGEFDVVCGAGYVALEAMAAGCAVVGMGFSGCFGAVTPENLDRAVACNFGDQILQTVGEPAEVVAQELQKAAHALSGGGALDTSDRVRELFDAGEVGRRLLGVYRAARDGTSVSRHSRPLDPMLDRLPDWVTAGCVHPGR